MTNLDSQDGLITIELLKFASQLIVPDAIIRRMRIDSFRDASTRSVVYSFSSYVASRRQWEEVREIPRKLTWRERIRCLFGGELITQVNYKAYRNCPHIDMSRTDHLNFLAPVGSRR